MNETKLSVGTNSCTSSSGSGSSSINTTTTTTTTKRVPSVRQKCLLLLFLGIVLEVAFRYSSSSSEVVLEADGSCNSSCVNDLHSMPKEEDIVHNNNNNKAKADLGVKADDDDDDEVVFRARMDGFLRFFDSESATDPESGLTEIVALHKYMRCEQKGGTADNDDDDDDDDDYLIKNPDAYTRIPTKADYALIIEAYLYAMAKNRGGENNQEAEATTTSAAAAAAAATATATTATATATTTTTTTVAASREQQQRTQPLPPPTVTSYNPRVFRVPVEVRSMPHIGRGIFAKEDIRKGTLVSVPANAIEFYNKEIYRDFVAYSYSKGSEIICDTMLWMYAARKTPDDYIICLDADDSSLINDGTWYRDDDDDDTNDDDDDDNNDDTNDDDNYDDDDDDDYDGTDKEDEDLNEDDGADEEENDEELNKGGGSDKNENEGGTEEDGEGGGDEDEDQTIINVGQYIVPRATDETKRTIYGCQGPPAYALRDIRAGEELLMTYSDFSEAHGFIEMGYFHDI